jgi:hypothetical protein
MSTNAVIAVVEKNQTRAITVHWDGDSCMPILVKNYSDRKLAKKLVDLGDLSILGKSIGKKQDFDAPTKGTCVAYGRDRGDGHTEAMIFPSVENFFELAGECYQYCAFIYVFEGGKWFSFGADYDESIEA